MSFVRGRAAALAVLLCLSQAACVGAAKKTSPEPAAQAASPLREAKMDTPPAGAAEQTASRQQGQEDTGAGLPQLVRQDYQLALGALKNGKFAVAETLLQPLVDRYPDLSGPLANMGIVYFNTGRDDQALEAFEKVTKMGPNAIASNYIGIIYRRKGEFDKARHHYQQAIIADSTYANAYLNLGILQDLYLGNLSAALVSYRQYQQLTGGTDSRVAKWIVDIERRL